MSVSVRPGMDLLLDSPAELRNARVGLVCHPASATSRGVHSSVALRKTIGGRLTCLLGPEHGVAGRGGAGEKLDHARHEKWGIPVYSLYGDTRRPTAAMLRRLDVIVFDLQDLGARPYTYVSTLRYVLEAAAEHGKRVIVADRPVPLAHAVDGPVLDPRFESFVGGIPSPVVYGMTPGETALWLQRTLKLDVDLKIARAAGYRRQGRPRYRWIPSSPAIVSWDSGLCFPLTVFFEALPAVDHARGTRAPFQAVGAPWLDTKAVCSKLRRGPETGVSFTPCRYRAAIGAYRGQLVQGIRLHVKDPRCFLPVQTSVLLLDAIRRVHGMEQLWNAPGSRPAFFDKLMGADSARKGLLSGEQPERIFASWGPKTEAFLKSRDACLLYS
ncbi:MAG: hypothetical protein BWY59_01072 [Verrucomicrobia bacterium ADurb.Bin345]|nr:MAG: hypothetical protein BWY59_01072 [Verrucomicrobia bacterium ADurb.Bin345]